MRISHRTSISLVFCIFGCLLAEPVWANVGIPVIAVTFMGMAYALIPVILIEATVFIARLDVSVWKSVMVITVTNLVTTFVGMPVTWLLFFLVSSLGSSLLIESLPKLWRPQNQYLYTNFFTPWWHPSPDIERNLHWIFPTAMLILFVPFFFSSWFIEYQLAYRMFENLDRGKLNDAIFAGNLLTYALFALVVAVIWAYGARHTLISRLRMAIRRASARHLPSKFGIPRRKLYRRILIPVGASIVVAVFYIGLSHFIVSSSLATMRTDYESTPAASGLAAERIHFKSAWDGLPITGWLLPSWGECAVVMVHGLDGNAWSGADPEIVRAYVAAGFHVLVFDLRGQGQSGGTQLGLGWDERGDVRAAVDFLLNRGFQSGKIGLHGTSYGAATALLSAAIIPEVGAVVSDSAFADMRDLMDAEIERRTGVPSQLVNLVLRPGIAMVANLYYSLDFDLITPEKAISQIAPRPILLIHGENDKDIPVYHLRRLKDAAIGDRNDVWILPGLGHTEGVWIWKERREVSPMREAFLQRIITFFDQSLQSNTNRSL